MTFFQQFSARLQELTERAIRAMKVLRGRRIELDAETARFHRRVLGMLHAIIENQESIMHTLDEVLDKVMVEDTKVDSIIVFLDGLKKQLADALAGVLTPAQQAKVDAIFDTAVKGADKIDAAMVANTDAPPG